MSAVTVSPVTGLPDTASGDALVLRAARHPLLERTLKARGVAVIPLTVELDAQHRQIIISGPNTGGKTVGLKTVGLLALMAQSGLPLPADRAELPIFDSVFADIGDYQSIEQNLSTFSSHVTNIDFISHHATAHSLVLLDELGSATDPEEGAALAVAIAEYFRRAACINIIATHHTALKVYAANTPGVLNAAVGFDEHTFAPTFELRIGVPGRVGGHQHRPEAGTEFGDCRRRQAAHDLAGARHRALSGSLAHRLTPDRLGAQSAAHA